MNNDNDKKFDKVDPPEATRDDSTPKEDATELMLVAYLDGELEETERTELEARLAAQPALRRRLQQLRQAWDLLDELEASSPSKRFAETTLEMVAIDAESHLRGEAARKRRAVRRRRSWIGLVMLAALGAGFVLTWLLYPAPDALLIKNLSVIQKLDQYESAESVAFLEALVEAKLFPHKPTKKPEPSSSKANKKAADFESGVQEEPTLDQAPSIPASDRLRREWVKNLQPLQRAQLEQNLERFKELSPEERKKLITLHDQLAESDRSELLTKVMYQYNKWLQRRSSFERNDLLKLSAEDRIKRLRSLRQRVLNRKGLQRWVAVKKKAMKDRFPKGPSPPKERPKPPKNSFPGFQYRPWMRNTDWFWISRFSDQDFADLKQYLSGKMARQWDKKSVKEQRQWVRRNYVPVQMEQAMQRRSFRQGESVSDEDLDKFFNRLSPEKQSKLFTEPGDLLRQKLIELYKQSLRRRPPHNDRPGNSRHQNRRGARGHGRRQMSPPGREDQRDREGQKDDGKDKNQR